MRYEDSIVLITGGASGLGKGIVEYLTARNATVVSIDLNDTVLDGFKDQRKLRSIRANLFNDNFYSEVLPGLFNEYKFNVLINNAGILHNKPLVSFGSKGFSKLTNEDLDYVIRLNLTIPIMISREMAEHMIKNRRKGVIINISSISANGNIGQSAYSAAKAGLESFTKVISKELGIWGIRAACVAPGYMDTKSTHDVMNDEYLKSLIKSMPLRRLGSVEEIATGVGFIIENDYYNGRTLAIDGGLTI